MSIQLQCPLCHSEDIRRRIEQAWSPFVGHWVPAPESSDSFHRCRECGAEFRVPEEIELFEGGKL